MKATKARKLIKTGVKHFVPNNPSFDREYNIDNGMDKDAVAYAKKHTLYDVYGYRRTASGNYVNRDEPPEKIQFKQADAIRKNLQAKKAAAGREKLKAGNKVPIKAGAKLFEDFCREAYKNNRRNSSIVDLENIYNAALHLPYDKWLIVVGDEFKNNRYKKA
jgi:hypothetical protein